MSELDPDLSAGQITDFRQNWIRDEYDASGLPVTPVVQLSEYNKSRKAEFFTDANFQTIYDRLRNEWAEELEAIRYEKEQERLDEGDDATTAEAAGDATREEAVFRLMRVWCRKQMARDPGFRASLNLGTVKGGLDALLKEWSQENAEDIAWVRSRAGRFAAIEVERG